MTMEKLEEDLSKLKKKRKQLSTATLQRLDGLIDAVSRFKRAKLGANAPWGTTTETTEQLESLSADTPSEFSNLIKGYRANVSKFTKATEKLLASDADRVFRGGGHLSKPAITQWILQHLTQEGYFETAQRLAAETGQEPSNELMEELQHLYRLIEDIRVRKDLQHALSWAQGRSKELQQIGSDLEFALHRLVFLQMVTRGRPVKEILDFAQKSLGNFSETHLQDIQKLLCCVLFVNRLGSSPYASYTQEQLWEDAEHLLLRDGCALLSLPYPSAISSCLEAGTLALPKVTKMVKIMPLEQWKALDELPVDVPLPQRLQFHSLFSCPVSKELSTPANPPVLLRCGHVVCRSCVDRFLKNSSSFKCPTCPAEQSEEYLREICL